MLQNALLTFTLTENPILKARL